MERRMAALETSIERLERAITEQKTEIAELRATVNLGRVELSILRQLIEFLPTKAFMAATVLATGVLVAALVAWQPVVQNWLGVGR